MQTLLKCKHTQTRTHHALVSANVSIVMSPPLPCPTRCRVWLIYTHQHKCAHTNKYYSSLLTLSLSLCFSLSLSLSLSHTHTHTHTHCLTLFSPRSVTVTTKSSWRTARWTASSWCSSLLSTCFSPSVNSPSPHDTMIPQNTTRYNKNHKIPWSHGVLYMLGGS